MGFWDSQLGDLEALGMVFTDEEIEVLENGGRAVHLRCLPSWDPVYYEQAGGLEKGTDGQVILLPETILAVAPTSLLSENEWGVRDSGPPLVADALEAEYGELWRAWPSAIGSVDQKYTEIYGHGSGDWIRGETTRPYRFWALFPDPGPEILRPIEHAALELLDDSHYWDMAYICQTDYDNMQTGDGIYPPYAWAYVYAPDLLGEEEQTEVESFMAQYGDEDSSEVRIIANVYRQLIDAGMMLPLGEDPITRRNEPELEQFASKIDNPAARFWYEGVVAQYHARVALVRSRMDQSHRNVMDLGERYIA